MEADGSGPSAATRVPEIPDVSKPTPAPKGLHFVVAKAVRKNSGFTPIVYLKTSTSTGSR